MSFLRFQFKFISDLQNNPPILLDNNVIKANTIAYASQLPHIILVQTSRRIS